MPATGEQEQELGNEMMDYPFSIGAYPSGKWIVGVFKKIYINLK